MAVEVALYPSQLNTAWPQAIDFISEGDDHIRVTKTVLKTTFSQVMGAVMASHTEMNHLVGVTSAIQTQLNAKAPLASPVFTGVPTAPTAAQGTNTLQLATTAYVVGEFAFRFSGLAGVPVTVSAAELNALAGIGGNVQALLNAKGAIAGQVWGAGAHNFGGSASVTLPAATTIGAVTAAELARVGGVTSAIQTQIDSKAAIAAQVYGAGTHDFTPGTLRAQTLPAGTSTTEVATTAHVAAVSFAAALPGQAGNARKFVTTDGTNASWAYPELPTRLVTANGALIAGWNNVITGAGLTLTMPAGVVGDLIGITVASDNVTSTLDWGTARIRGQATLPGVMTLNNKNLRAFLRCNGTGPDNWV